MHSAESRSWWALILVFAKHVERKVGIAQFILVEAPQVVYQICFWVVAPLDVGENCGAALTARPATMMTCRMWMRPWKVPLTRGMERFVIQMLMMSIQVGSSILLFWKTSKLKMRMAMCITLVTSSSCSMNRGVFL